MNPAAPLRRLAIAAWGVCWGVLLATLVTAALIAPRGDTDDQLHPACSCGRTTSSPTRWWPWQERYEHVWYVLVCAAGAAGAWLAGFVRPSPWLAALAAVAFVPAATDLCRGVFAAKLVNGRLLTRRGDSAGAAGGAGPGRSSRHDPLTLPSRTGR